MKQKMTIHRGLAELKLIDSKIEKAINTIVPTGIMQEGKLVNNIYQKEDFEKSAKAKFQSIQDLLDRKTKIKAAIIRANVTTEVTISSRQMTIADAINYKALVKSKKRLIQELEKKYRQSKLQVEEKNAKIEENAIRLAEAALQKDNVKINEGDAIAITEPYLKRNNYHLVDPLKVEEMTGKMQDEVDDFETEVDAVLSEINAITTIEI